MAFLIQNWSRQSVALNTGKTDVDGAAYGGPAIFTYRSATDDVATISAANYFAPDAAVYDLSVGDIIMGLGSDASFALQVLTLDREANTITTGSMGLTTSIGTANIVDGAVTTAKLADNAVTSAKLALNVLQYAAVAVSSADFLGMYATPKLLVAAGGANTLIVLDKVDLLMTYNSAAYAAGGVVAVQYANTANGAGVIASTTLAAASFQATASTGFMFNTGVVAQTFTTCVNQGLYLSNITGEFTTGNSAFVAHCWYKVIPSI